MVMARISTKGQITLPAAARRTLGLKPKSRVEVEVRKDEIIIRPIKSIREVEGFFRDIPRDKSGDWETVRSETERIVAEEVAREGTE